MGIYSWVGPNTCFFVFLYSSQRREWHSRTSVSLSLFLRSPPPLPSSHGIYRPRARRGRLNKIWILITRLYTDIQLTCKSMRIFLVSSITVSQSLAANCWHWCAEWLNNLPTHKSTTWCNSRRPFIASSTRWRRIPWQHAARRPPCYTIISSHYTLRSTR